MMRTVTSSGGETATTTSRAHGLTSILPPAAAAHQKLDIGEIISSVPFFLLYKEKPKQGISLFQLEQLVMNRMELLAKIDAWINSPTLDGTPAVLEKLKPFVQREYERVMKSHVATLPAEMARGIPSEAILKAGLSLQDKDLEAEPTFTPQEDALSHYCCRLVFCQSEEWRSWFVRTEEILLQARIRFYGEKWANQKSFLSHLFEAANLECTPLSVGYLHEHQLVWLSERHRGTKIEGGGSLSSKALEILASQFYLLPISHALTQIRTRNTICVSGKAVVHKSDVVNGFFLAFKHTLRAGLREALYLRQSLHLRDPENAKNSGLVSVTQMLDAFFTRFVVDPAKASALQSTVSGSITPSEIPNLAKAHFPLCMSRIDDRLRAIGHVKHHGRWQYGLFLKHIGLSVEDSLILFSSLMTVKGGGSLEKFNKSSYGYNIRHMHGKEGKRTSYTSQGCPSVINMGPMLDQHDCHGCPFRFKDERILRHTLENDRVSPGGKLVKPSASEIEDIVKDAKEQHYTRACYKYFLGTHPDQPLRRDTLFRSPGEYFTQSVELQKQFLATHSDPNASPQASVVGSPGGAVSFASSEAAAGTTSGKRTLFVKQEIAPQRGPRPEANF